MKTYRYSGFDREGRPRKGVVEAADPREARILLTRQGILPGTLADVAAADARGSRPFRLDERSIFYRELSTLLKAGIPLLPGVQTLSAMPEFAASRLRMGVARDRIREGAGLGEALEKAELGLNPFERAAIDAGMRAGVMEESLDRLAMYLQEQQELRAKVGSALTYPVVVLVFALLVSVVMLGFVLPSALGMIQRSGARIELPALTRAMMSVRETGLWLLPLLVVVIGGTVWLVRRQLRTHEAFRIAADRWLFRLPAAGRAYGLLVNLRFARTFAMVLRGGVAAEEGLVMAGRACGSPWVEQRSREEGEAVRHGSSLTEAVSRIPPLEAALPSWIQTGETSGSLADMLDHAANRIQQQWNRYTTRLLSLLEPALILVVGGLVFLVVLSIILPLIRMSSGLMD